MSDQQPTDPSWQWNDAAWGDTPAAPTSADQVPESDDTPEGWSPAVRRLLRWASR